jgi:WXXGXW repeat (2 copies)
MKMHRSIRWLVFAVMMLSLSAAAFGQIAVGISVRVAPPALPVYTQPVAPGPGHLWTPGYWAWNDDAGYYWVPGTWVVAPVGLLWTPGYWGWADGAYGWHRGYWGPHIGFYGGVNYGFGYGGSGFEGGEWRGNKFYYNRSVTNVTNVTTVYNKTVIVNENHAAFNGGEGGVKARPTHEEEMAEHEHHREPLAEQSRHEHMASQNKQNFASANHGRPAVAATAKPGEFKGRGVVAAKSAGAPYKAPAMSPKQARATAKPATNHASAANANHKNKPENHASATSNKKTTASSKTNSNHPNSVSNKKTQDTAHPSQTHAAKASAPPAHSSHTESQPHQSAPKSTPSVKPVAQHQSAPKPAVQHQSAPAAPQHQSAPKAAPKQGKGH